MTGCAVGLLLPMALQAVELAVDDIEEIVITSTRVQTAATRATSAKSDAPLIEIPQAISVVGSDYIKDLQIRDLGDALRGVAGVSRSSTYGFYDAYVIRGYDAAYGSIYLDGLMETNVAGANNELAGLERVEVVKGPASALFGASPLGGVVNLVSKRPQRERFVDVSVGTGSYNLIESSVDANSPLNDSGTLLGRLNVLYRDTDDFVKNSGENRLFIAPVLSWEVDSGTHLTLLTRYQRDRDNPWSPYTAYGTVLPSANGELPSDFAVNFAGSDKSHSDLDKLQLGYVFDHAFSDALKFGQTLRYSHTRTAWNNWVFSDTFIDSSFVDGVQQGRELGLYVYGPYEQTDRDLAVDSRVTYKWVTGPVEHQLMVGVDHRRNHNEYADKGGNFDSSVNTLDVVDPDYAAALIHDAAYAYSGESSMHQTGTYVQDHLAVGGKFFATLGGRWDSVNSDGFRNHAFSPNVGLNYFVTPAVSLYANWAKSFTPQYSWQTTFEGATLPPETGRNIEGGVKIGTSDDTLGAMVSVFQLTRQNVGVSDPDHPLFYIVTGEQRSRGLEVEGTWIPQPAWTLQLAYTHLDAVITRDTSIPVGTELSNVPRNNLYVFGKYVIQQGALANSGVNLSVLYNSEKNSSLYEADTNGDGIPEPAVKLPGYTIVDAGLSYSLFGWETRFALNNVFDRRYYPDANDFTRVTPGEPRNWKLSVSKRF
ncbi:MAG: TonB-dependent siderophore receptor [Steroidobacteraceae bacterium]